MITLDVRSRVHTMNTIFNLSHSLPPMKRYRQQEQEEERSEKRYRHEVAAEQQEGEGANCLMLLSRADSSFEPETTQSANRMYECKTCSRSFPSFQALGGHRASHKKPKGSGDCSSISNQLQSSKTKPKVHECSICGSEFAIGQALGGHMRRHRSSVDRFSHASPVVKKSNSRRVLCIDLNLPPLEDDLQLCSKGFSGGFLERVAMVDCFN